MIGPTSAGGGSAFPHVLGGLLLLYGLLANLLFLDLFVHWAYGTSYRGIATTLALRAGVSAVAGLCFWALALRLLKRPTGATGGLGTLVGKGLLCGIAATFIALEAAGIAISGYLAYHGFRDYGGQARILLAGFIAGLIGMQTIEIPAVLLSLPFAAAYGAIGGAAAFQFYRRCPP